MNTEEFKQMVVDIVKEAEKLKDEKTGMKGMPVNYACIFCQSDREFEKFFELASEIGNVIKETKTGPLFLVSIQTPAGMLKLLKVRKPDLTRKERGDADFTVGNFDEFKQKFLGKPGFSLIKREGFEMVELFEKGRDVRVYFSNPPLDRQLGL